MSSACDGNAIINCSTKSASGGTGATGMLVISAFAPSHQGNQKKAGSSALSGGKIAPKPDKVRRV